MIPGLPLIEYLKQRANHLRACLKQAEEFAAELERIENILSLYEKK